MPDIPFSDLLKSDDLCRGLAEGILRDHGPLPPLKRIREGSNILFDLGGSGILKVFSRDERDFRENEALFLRTLPGRLPVRVPELLHSGEHRGYPYLIMQAAAGVPLKSAWDDLDEMGRSSVCQQLGRLVKELHSIPSNTVEGCVPVWGTFIESQKERLAENHARYGLDPGRIQEILEFVDDWDPVEMYEPAVVCHTELMREHLFIELRDGAPVLSALIDFEPSMLAVPQYEMCAVGLFITAGDPHLYGSFLDSYASGADMSVTTIMRMLLLHRYSNMNWFMSALPVDVRASDLLGMGQYWFGRS